MNQDNKRFLLSGRDLQMIGCNYKKKHEKGLSGQFLFYKREGYRYKQNNLIIFFFFLNLFNHLLYGFSGMPGEASFYCLKKGEQIR